jgi:hypothetical protein
MIIISYPIVEDGLSTSGSEQDIHVGFNVLCTALLGRLLKRFWEHSSARPGRTHGARSQTSDSLERLLVAAGGRLGERSGCNR